MKKVKPNFVKQQVFSKKKLLNRNPLYARWRTGEWCQYRCELIKEKKITRNHRKIGSLYDLRNIELRRISLKEFNLSKTDLSEAIFYMSTISGTIIEESILDYSDFVLCRISKVSFRDSSLEGTDFSEAQLIDVDLTNASLTGVNFKHVYANNVIINDAIMDDISLILAQKVKFVGVPKSMNNIKIDSLTFNMIDNMELKEMIRLNTDVDFTYDYQIAISFAGEDRQLAERFAHDLTERSISVFYDDFERAELWGKDLFEYLTDIYHKKSRFCLMIISENYIKKNWTNLERRAVFAHLLEINDDYLLPLRLDDTEIPGLLPTRGFIKYDDTEHEKTLQILLEKIRCNKII